MVHSRKLGQEYKGEWFTVESPKPKPTAVGYNGESFNQTVSVDSLPTAPILSPQPTCRIPIPQPQPPLIERDRTSHLSSTCGVRRHRPSGKNIAGFLFATHRMERPKIRRPAQRNRIRTCTGGVNNIQLGANTHIAKRKTTSWAASFVYFGTL